MQGNFQAHQKRAGVGIRSGSDSACR